MSAEQYGARLLEEVQEERLDKVSFYEQNSLTRFISVPLHFLHILPKSTIPRRMDEKSHYKH